MDHSLWWKKLVKFHNYSIEIKLQKANYITIYKRFTACAIKVFNFLFRFLIPGAFDDQQLGPEPLLRVGL